LKPKAQEEDKKSPKEEAGEKQAEGDTEKEEG